MYFRETAELEQSHAKVCKQLQELETAHAKNKLTLVKVKRELGSANLRQKRDEKEVDITYVNK